MAKFTKFAHDVLFVCLFVFAPSSRKQPTVGRPGPTDQASAQLVASRPRTKANALAAAVGGQREGQV